MFLMRAFCGYTTNITIEKQNESRTHTKNFAIGLWNRCGEYEPISSTDKKIMMEAIVMAATNLLEAVFDKTARTGGSRS
jgi:hypothetical protein